MRKHSRWKSGKLHAYIFFRSARLLRFGCGVQGPCRPIVDLHTSTLDGFCDGSKDFLKLSRLLSKFHSVDHSKNVHECLACVHVLRGTYGGTYGNKNSGTHIDVQLDPKSLMSIWDTGASFGLTPFQSDFIDYMAYTIPVRDVTKVNNIIGIGATLHKFTYNRGFPVYLLCVSYHLSQMDIHLFSPQTCHQMHGGYSEVYGNCIKMLLKTSKIQI
jgi:hypothetical protein